ncbi:MAG: glycosyltransferase family 4 protein [Cytophagaceae bacterium]
MKVVLLNTTEKTGGAAKACLRVFNALAKVLDVSLLVQDKSSDLPSIISVSESKISKISAFLRFSIERLWVLTKIKKKDFLYSFSPANTGLDIKNHKEIGNADIIHLHWINFGFLSLKSLKKIVALKKPIVWTLHDMWAFTGGCHYSGECTNFKTGCGNCFYLKTCKPDDSSKKIWNKKMHIFKDANLTIVTSSNWLGRCASNSQLFKTTTVKTIPTPIDSSVYKILDKNNCRKKLNLPTDKKLILFGCMNIEDERKGFRHLQNALKFYLKQFPDSLKDTEVVVFGKSSHISLDIDFKIHSLGLINSEEKLVMVYNAADTFVLPSLEDNLPNTVMESMACGTPVTAFDLGGIPDMIEHQVDGYMAEPKNSVDLANGIHYILTNQEALGMKARQKMETYFNESFVATQYTNLYKEILKTSKN